ncbi:MAG: hypothetical protein Q8M51_02890 [Polaromonas sp.]|uniref:hypothetical protein n=1 Tax=Polaromonas sp. TaxID=1869339 RepID=UPI00272F3296|nr:hypothetical protein [Polaromonas sp.]MDP1741635.1 hypothetical protein [Polaromonas sp.]MDP3354798.1 hypothetical protein [Polaromonas sp.]
MKLLSSTCAKRHTAFLVLLLWVFALASGVANACLLEVRGTHGHLAAVGSEAAAAPVVSAGHAGAVAHHDDDADSSLAPCQKACEDVAKSPHRQDLTTAQADPGPMSLVSILWTAATPVVPALVRLDRMQPLASERPIRLRYSRLAL